MKQVLNQFCFTELDKPNPDKMYLYNLLNKKESPLPVKTYPNEIQFEHQNWYCTVEMAKIEQ